MKIIIQDISLKGSYTLPFAFFDLKAGNEVNLKPGFHAASGSEVHIFNTPVFVDCSEISTLGFRHNNSSVVAETSSTDIAKEKEVEINFYENKNEIKAVIYPNPNNGNFTLQLFGNINQNSINKIRINDCIGNKIMQKQFNGTQLRISFPFLNHGIYFIHIQSGGQLIIQKFVII